jgi:hypothetical protein
MRRCLYRSVTISDRRMVEQLSSVSPPAAFRHSPLLNDYRLVLLGVDGTARVGSQIIRVDPRLGIVIERVS